MTLSLAIMDPAERTGIGGRIFGKDVANFQLFQALVRDAGLEKVDFLMRSPIAADVLRDSFEAGPGAAEIRVTGLLDHAAAARAGTLFRGAAQLENQAWFRARTTGDAGYSLIGLIHTIAPYAIREQIANAVIAPVHPWDAIVCTSPAVQAAITEMFDAYQGYLVERYGGVRAPRPQLPLLPLGVDAQRYATIAGRDDVRASVRAKMGVGEGDVLLLWVGRLSFFEKAFPQPMMMAAERAAQETGCHVHFAMVGWFPDEEVHSKAYCDAAAMHAPSVSFHIVDGRDPADVDEMWAASDVFISLVDNIQETFGLTPVEAMACGRPVVVSDWDGYRYTVQHGGQGFLIPSLIGPAGSLIDLGEQHVLGLRSYQNYVGVTAQHTAIHVAKAGEAIAELIRSPDLRARMGAAGRRRVAEMFDYKVVAPQFAALAAELAAVRSADKAAFPPRRVRPVKGDPFRDFAGFATNALTHTTRLWPVAGVTIRHLARARLIDLDRYGHDWRLSHPQADALFSELLQHGPMSVGTLLASIPSALHQRSVLTMMWMAKMGFVEWTSD